MPILNESLRFEMLPIDVRSAFTGFRATKVLLPWGTSLFRFSGHSRISPWWSETNQLSILLLTAKARNHSLFEYARNTTAIKRLWDFGLFNLIIVRLKQPVYAFSGFIAPQNEAAQYKNSQDFINYKKKFTKPVFFSGGNGQVYIKDLEPRHVDFIVPAGAVNIYDDVTEIMDFLISYRII